MDHLASFKVFMAAANAFASVKLSDELVKHAKDAAKPLRRSAAGQIEYWATLGRGVEAQGLSAGEAQAAIESYEKAAALDALTSKIIAAHADHSLVSRVREIVKENRLLSK
jgi:ParD-like antitoxin of type II bacterial toxin-antitoxin system